MKKYMIADPNYYPLRDFSNLLARAYRLRPDFICLRDKKTRNYPAFARRFLLQARRYKARLVLHNDYLLAKAYRCGVHLSAARRREIKAAARSLPLTIASCHSANEAKRALKNGADFVTLSPIFATPNKGEPKGATFLNALEPTIRKKAIALGGIIGAREIAALAETGVFAFASIRYFLGDQDGV
ncbi:MAG: thiamine phosphate synthase [Helicobacteraceae bacterium]|jgi:thiamine-phosphate pyrophosphorylase|nr:thiamine phosphate synthase [Helicobacteraceae bacterium]